MRLWETREERGKDERAPGTRGPGSSTSRSGDRAYEKKGKAGS
jgi:hypothetical protein